MRDAPNKAVDLTCWSTWGSDVWWLAILIVRTTGQPSFLIVGVSGLLGAGLAGPFPCIGTSPVPRDSFQSAKSPQSAEANQSAKTAQAAKTTQAAEATQSSDSDSNTYQTPEPSPWVVGVER